MELRRLVLAPLERQLRQVLGAASGGGIEVKTLPFCNTLDAGRCINEQTAHGRLSVHPPDPCSTTMVLP